MPVDVIVIRDPNPTARNEFPCKAVESMGSIEDIHTILAARYPDILWKNESAALVDSPNGVYFEARLLLKGRMVKLLLLSISVNQPDELTAFMKDFCVMKDWHAYLLGDGKFIY